MIPPVDSLVKYGNPVFISKKTDPKSKAGPLSQSAEATKQQCEEILDVVLPPREWTEGNKLWKQHVSSAPCSREDVMNLEELLDTKIQQRQAKITGICPLRRELYSQCLDELIRQVTINCAERGLLLLRVRNESQMALATYQMLYESNVAYGIRKVLQAEKGKRDMEKRIEDLENETEDLKRQLNEQKAEREINEKREAEKCLLEQTKYTTEIHRLTITNEQLKDEIKQMITPRM